MPTEVPDSQVQDRRTEAPAVSNSRKRRESDISLLDVFNVLAKRKGTVLGITVAFAIGSADIARSTDLYFLGDIASPRNRIRHHWVVH